MANSKIHQHMAFFQEKNELVRNFARAATRMGNEMLQLTQGDIGQQQLLIIRDNLQRIHQQFNFLMEQLERMQGNQENVFFGNTI